MFNWYILLILFSTVHRSYQVSAEQALISIISGTYSLIALEDQIDPVRVSKKYLNRQIQINGLDSYIVIPYLTHMDEMCKGDRDICWCGFSQEREHLKNISLGLAFLKICINTPYWSKNKTTIFQARVSIPDSEDVKISQAAQIDSLVKEYQEELGTDKEKTKLEYNIHNEKLCPAGFSWCWCGIVPRYKDYIERKTGSKPKPLVVIDCRPSFLRPFEKRDCSQRKPDMPWYQRIFTKEFPCGHY